MLDTATGSAGQHRNLDTCVCQPFQLSWLMNRVAGHRVGCVHIDYYLSASARRLAQASAKLRIAKSERSQGHFVSTRDLTDEMIGHCVGLNTVHQTQKLPTSAMEDVRGMLRNVVVALKGVTAAQAAAIIRSFIVTNRRCRHSSCFCEAGCSF